MYTEDEAVAARAGGTKDPTYLMSTQHAISPGVRTRDGKTWPDGIPGSVIRNVMAGHGQGWDEDRRFYKNLGLSGISGKKVLEFGCGSGLDSYYIAKLGAVLTSCDIVPSNVEITRRVLDIFPKCRAVLLDGYRDIAELGQFDVIFSSGVLHHIPPEFAKEAVEIMKRQLKSQGYFVVMVYTIAYYREENFWREGPYACGYDAGKLQRLFGDDMVVSDFRIFNKNSYMTARIDWNRK